MEHTFEDPAPPAERPGGLWLLGPRRAPENRLPLRLRDAFPHRGQGRRFRSARRICSNSACATSSTWSAETPGNLEEERTVAYAIYLLTREEVITTNYILNLRDYLDQ